MCHRPDSPTLHAEETSACPASASPSPVVVVDSSHHSPRLILPIAHSQFRRPSSVQRQRAQRPAPLVCTLYAAGTDVASLLEAGAVHRRAFRAVHVLPVGTALARVGGSCSYRSWRFLFYRFLRLRRVCAMPLAPLFRLFLPDFVPPGLQFFRSGVHEPLQLGFVHAVGENSEIPPGAALSVRRPGTFCRRR